MVRNKSCWDANNAVGLSRQSKVGLDYYEVLKRLACKISSLNRVTSFTSLVCWVLSPLRFTSGPSFVPGAAIELEPGKTVLDAYLDQAVEQAVQSHMGGEGGAGAGGGGGAGAGAEAGGGGGGEAGAGK